MTRTMYDSTNPAAIPTSAALVGGYTDGIYGPEFKAIGRSSTGWDAAAWARFPNSVHILISAIGTNTGTVGDVEPGCMTPAQGVQWTLKRRAAGVDPTIYCNQTYGWGPVRQAFRVAGVAEPHYWVANYDRVIVIPKGAVAKQYANPALSGGGYDLSVVADFWPGVDNSDDNMGRIDNDQFYRLLQPVYGLQLGADGTVQKDAQGVPIPTPAMKTLMDAIAKIPGGTPIDLHALAATVEADIAAKLVKP